MKTEDVIYDWNTVESKGPITTKPIVFMDETLRDGIQSPSATDPSIEDKLELLNLTRDLLRARAVLLSTQPQDPDPKAFDQQIAGA